MEQATLVNEFLTYGESLVVTTPKYSIFQSTRTKGKNIEKEYYFYKNSDLLEGRTPKPVGVFKICQQGYYEVNSEHRVISQNLFLLVEEIVTYDRDDETNATLITIFDLENFTVNQVKSNAFPESWYVLNFQNNLLMIKGIDDATLTKCIDICTGMDIIVSTTEVANAEQNTISMPEDSTCNATYIFGDKIIHEVVIGCGFITFMGNETHLITDYEAAYLIDPDTYVSKCISSGCTEGSFRLLDSVYIITNPYQSNEFELHKVEFHSKGVDTTISTIDTLDSFLMD